MNRGGAAREAWHPATREEREAVRRQLEEILISPHFCNSRRYPALLRHIVEYTLDGRQDLLKERTLGVDVFERPPSYDTNADTVVRFTAGEVRKRLALYYHELERRPSVHISLPPGSYVPEFHWEKEAVRPGEPSDSAGIRTEVLAENPGAHAAEYPATGEAEISPRTLLPGPAASSRAAAGVGRRGWAVAALLAIVAALTAGFGWKSPYGLERSALAEFWAPLLQDHHTIMVCTGGVVFKQGNFSGVVTAGKDIDYPFVSSQVASAIMQLSSLIERNGSSVDLQFSASTPITTLREQPVVLLGGYNNQWTLRLLNSSPFHFAPEPNASIVSGTEPRFRWARDMSRPYSSTDDYALVARFRDPTTDSWNVVVAGLGRNGTEAAGQFVTSEHYVRLLRQRLGRDFADRNVEAVLKVSVIEGKTGAPTLLEARMW